MLTQIPRNPIQCGCEFFCIHTQSLVRLLLCFHLPQDTALHWQTHYVASANAMRCIDRRNGMRKFWQRKITRILYIKIKSATNNSCRLNRIVLINRFTRYLRVSQDCRRFPWPRTPDSPCRTPSCLSQVRT